MNEENRKNSERKRKYDNLLEIDKGKIIKTEVEDTSGTESYESVPLFASNIKEELNAEIKSEPVEENVDDLNDVSNDSPEAVKDDCNIKIELFEESETRLQFFKNTTKIYENSNKASNDETQNKSYTSNKVNLNPADDVNKLDDNATENDENEELSTFNIASVKPLKKNDIIKETNMKNSLINRDEFDIFGDYIAKTLRSLPGELGIIAKTHIIKALSDFQMKALGQKQMTRLMYGVTSCQNPDCSNSQC